MMKGGSRKNRPTIPELFARILRNAILSHIDDTPSTSERRLHTHEDHVLQMTCKSRKSHTQIQGSFPDHIHLANVHWSDFMMRPFQVRMHHGTCMAGVSNTPCQTHREKQTSPLFVISNEATIEVVNITALTKKRRRER